MLRVERRRSREQEAFEAWRLSSRALDVSTDIVERLRPYFGYIDRSFDYILKHDGLYQQEVSFRRFLQKGRRTSEALRSDPDWAIEYERNLAEEREGEQVEALARGEYPEGTILVTVSADPEPVLNGRTVLTYRAEHPVALVRFWEKTNTGVRGRTISCEGSSPMALKMAVEAVAGPQLGAYFASLSSAEAIANPLPIQGQSSEVAEAFVRAYDNALFMISGQETNHGVPLERLKIGGELNTLIELPRYEDLVGEAYQRIFALDHQRLSPDRRRAEYEKIMQDIPAAIWLLAQQPQLATDSVSTASAAATARGQGFSSRAGCPTAPSGKEALSAQFGKPTETQAYRYIIKGECRACLEEKLLPPEDEGCGVCQDCTEYDNRGGDLMKRQAAALKKKLARHAVTQAAAPKAPTAAPDTKTAQHKTRMIIEFGGARREIFDESLGEWQPATD